MAMPTGLEASVLVILAGLVPTLAAMAEMGLPTAPAGTEASSVWEILRTGVALRIGASLVPVIVTVIV